jgi:anaerobic selenocysteine-containing dehydrogenase
LAYTENGRLIRVSGDPKQYYTAGTLCSKGYSYISYVYHPDRIRYPIRQIPRGSGNWQRIGWDVALQEISQKILEIYYKNGNLFPLAFMDGKANTGILARTIQYMLSSVGPITELISPGSGNPGLDAEVLDFGQYCSRDPEEMKKTDLIVLWGINPAVTAIHQMRFLQQVRKRGTTIILIDVFPSATARYVDDIILVNPGGDGALALAVIRELLYKNSVDYHYILQETEGWEDLKDWLLVADPEKLHHTAGVSANKIEFLAEKIRTHAAVSFWLGKGLQKYKNSEQNLQAIHALAAAGGIQGNTGGGIFFRQAVDDFSSKIWDMMHLKENGKLNSKLFPAKIVNHKPELQMLWVTQSNPLVQGVNLQTLQKLMDGLELVVTTDCFLTPTALNSDIVLPGTTPFEAEDIVAGSWHRWVGYNEQAIRPLGEARSELDIARALTQVLNANEDGVCLFPAERNLPEWLQLAMPAKICALMGIENYEQLKNGPRKLPSNEIDALSSEKARFRFKVPEGVAQEYQETLKLVRQELPPPAYPYRLICIRQADRLNSQYGNLSWIMEGQNSHEILVGAELAGAKGIATGNKVTLYNSYGEVVFIAKVCKELLKPVLMCSARQDLNGRSINCLVSDLNVNSDNDSKQASNAFFHETFVNIVRL